MAGILAQAVRNVEPGAGDADGKCSYDPAMGGGDEELGEAWDSSLIDRLLRDAPAVREPSYEERRRAAERAAMLRRAEAARVVVLADEARAARARRRRALRVPVACLLFFAMIVGLAVWVRSGSEESDAASLDVVDTVGWQRGSRPSPSGERSSRPVGTQREVADPGRGYAFMATQPDGTTPVAYDPCRPIHYVVSAGGAPRELTRLVDNAIATLSEATGLKFVDDGSTSERPSERRAAFQPKRYGDRWAPVLIAWSDADRYPSLEGSVLGIGGSVPVEDGGRGVYVTGQLVLDTEDLGQILGASRGAQLARSTIEHELGHVVGLDHVADPTQLMYPSMIGDNVTFGAGDLYGLAQVGRGDCFPDV